MKKILIIVTLSIILPTFAYANGLEVANPGSGGEFSNPAPKSDPGAGTTAPTGAGKQTTVTAKLQNPLKGVNSLGDLAYKVINAVVSIAYIVIGFFILLSGFKFITAQGSQDKLNDAKRTFFNTMIGAILIIGAHTITAIAESVIRSLGR